MSVIDKEISRAWNDMIDELSSGQSDYDTRKTNKRVPYFGWYWRNIPFHKQVPIGYHDAMVGFMANNKWYYPERILTDEERNKVCQLTASAYALYRIGDVENACKELEKLWPLMTEFGQNFHEDDVEEIPRHEASTDATTWWRPSLY